MYHWADIINDICYKLFIIYNVYGSHCSFLHQLNLYQHVYSFIFILARRICCNITAVHITDLILFLNQLTKGSLEVSEYQLSFGPSVIHAGHSFLLNLITTLQWYTEIKKNQNKRNICTITSRLTSTSTFIPGILQCMLLRFLQQLMPSLKVSLCKQMQIY